MNIVIQDKLNIFECVKKTLEGGHILAVYRECDKIYAENALKELVRHYMISKKILPSDVENSSDVVSEVMDTDEDVRLMLAFGGSEVAEIAKEASTMLGIGLIVVMTSPMIVDRDVSYIFHNDVIEMRRAVQAKMLVVDKSLISTRTSFQAVVARIGETILSNVDRLFGSLASGNTFEDNDVLSVLEIANKTSEQDKVSMLRDALQLKDNTHIVRRIAYTLSHYSLDSKNLSKYLFTITYTILLLYRGYIRCSEDDLLLPPDIVESAKRVSQDYMVNMSNSIMEYKTIGSIEYIRVLGVMQEYREELCLMLDKCIDAMAHLAKVYRRVGGVDTVPASMDITLDALLECISVMSIYEDNITPLRMMKIDGFLEHYIAHLAS